MNSDADIGHSLNMHEMEDRMGEGTKYIWHIVRMSVVLAAVVLSGLPNLVLAQEVTLPIRTEQQNYEEAIDARRVEMTVAHAKQGSVVAQFDLGTRYLSGYGVAQSDAEALHWFRQAAEQGHEGAQIELGMMFFQGRGASRDHAEAIRWYLRAAEQGDMYGQYNAGVMYQNGQGVARDAAQALHWYRQAAEQGHADAQNNLGVMYQNGQGVAQDAGQALHWYRKAAEQGNADAQNSLGVMYASGQGVAQNDTEAVRWFRRAAEQGDANAQYNLAISYGGGYGVQRDLTQAELWLDRAARQGHSKAAETRATMAARPTSKDDFATALGAIAVGAVIVGAVLSSDEKPEKADAAGDQGNKKTDDCRKQAEANIAVCDVVRDPVRSCTSYGKCFNQVSCRPAARCGGWLEDADLGRYYCDNRPSWILSSSRTISQDRETTLRKMMQEICP